MSKPPDKRDAAASRTPEPDGPKPAVQRWRRMGGAAVAAAAIAAVSWAVERGLDNGAEAIDPTSSVTAHVETDPARVFSGMPDWQTYDFVAPSSPSELRGPPSSRCRDWRA